MLANQITTIISASALPIDENDDQFIASVEFTTANGKFSITVDQIDDIYRGLVKSWPIIKPLKDELNFRRRTYHLAKTKSDKLARESALEAEREERKCKREALLALREAEKVEAENKRIEAIEKAEKAKAQRKVPKAGKVIEKEVKPSKKVKTRAKNFMKH